jgi:hypothetical protein
LTGKLMGLRQVLMIVLCGNSISVRTRRIRIRIWSANVQLTYTQGVYTQEVYAEGDLKTGRTSRGAYVKRTYIEEVYTQGD